MSFDFEVISTQNLMEPTALDRHKTSDNHGDLNTFGPPFYFKENNVLDIIPDRP